MDAIKKLATNAKFSMIERVYSGGFTFRARIDIKTLFEGLSFAGFPLTKCIDNPKFSQIVDRELDRLLFSKCRLMFGPQNIAWSIRKGKSKVQVYFKSKEVLKQFAVIFASIDEIGYPASEQVLTALLVPSTPKDEMIVYRSSLFFYQYRWRVTLIPRKKWRETDMEYLRQWVSEDADNQDVDNKERMLSEQEIDAKLYLATNNDVVLLRFGFNNLIRKVEKVLLHSELI